MTLPEIATREEWLEARKRLLATEKRARRDLRRMSSGGLTLGC
jgi:predicted dithiol-disulfide oxidoreductase (DUF899 family)